MGLANVIFPILQWESPGRGEVLALGQCWISCVQLQSWSWISPPGADRKHPPNLILAQSQDPSNPFYERFSLCDTLCTSREWCWKLFVPKARSQGVEWKNILMPRVWHAKGRICPWCQLTQSPSEGWPRGKGSGSSPAIPPQIAPPESLVSPWMAMGAVSFLAWTS